MQTIKDVPMLTADGAEITLNRVLYEVKWSSGYGFKGKGELSFEAHRVISVDNTRRFFRTRCKKGCETEHTLKSGCVKPLYRSFGSAKEYAQELIMQDIARCQAHVHRAKETAKSLAEEHKKALFYKIPMTPRAFEYTKDK